jgi:hypothetical protein
MILFGDVTHDFELKKKAISKAGGICKIGYNRNAKQDVPS